MELKHIWTSGNTRIGSRYAVKVLGGSLVLAVLAAALVAGCTTLLYRLGLMNEWVTLVLCLAVTALIVVAAFRLRRSVQRDRTIFYLTEDDRLFVLDAASQYRHTGGVLGMAEGAIKTEQFLNENACRPVLPAGADEILLAKEVRTYRRCHVLRCLVRHPNRQVVPKTYILPKGYAQEKALLCQLEGRRDPDPGPEPDLAPQTFLLLLSSLSLVALIGLCVLSHPAVARLPQAIYFPCLALALFAFYGMVYCIIRRRRGE